MSHMVKMTMPKIKNEETLKRACRNLGLVFDKTKKLATYYAGNKMKCDAVISCPGSTYEIALTQTQDGSYDMQMDSYCPTLTKKVGKSAGLLSQQYQIEEHKRIARSMGKEIMSCKTLPNGTIDLRIRA